MTWTKPTSTVRPSGYSVLILGAILAAISGLASALFPGQFIISVLLIPAAAALLLARPEYGLTIFIALVSDLLHPALIPKVPIMGGTLSAMDAMLAMLAAYAVWTVTATAKGERVRLAPVAGARWLTVSVGLFGISFVISVMMSLWVRDLAPSVVLGEARRLVYLIALPIALVILKQPARQRRFVRSVILVACLLSFGQILQGGFDVPVFGSQQLSSLSAVGSLGGETTRSITRGMNWIIFSLLLTVGAYLLGLTGKWKFVAIAGLLLAGIFVTYGRTTYVSVFVCLVIVVSLLNVRKLPQLGGILVIMIAIGSALGFFLKPDTLTAVFHRMTTIDEEINHGTSAGWRFLEAEAMLPHIYRNPLFGIGLGADYWNRGASLGPTMNRYIHNGYLGMSGKMGLPALALFLSFMAAIFAMGYRSARSNASPGIRVVGAAGASLMLYFAIASISEPHLMGDRSIAAIGIVGALVYLGARRASQESAAVAVDAAIKANR